MSPLALAAAPAQRTGDVIVDARRAHYSIADASGTENDTLTFTVTRSGDTSKFIVIAATVSNGTATSGVDYKRPPIAAAVFAPAETTATIKINMIRGAAVKPARSFTVTLLRAPDGGTLDRAEATGTILADVAPPPPPPPPAAPAQAREYYAIGDTSAREGQPLKFRVIRRGDMAQARTATVRIVGGTAVPGTDYRTGTLTAAFARGVRDAVVTVETVAREKPQPSRTVIIQLVGVPAGARADPRDATGTIVDMAVAPPPPPPPTPSPTPTFSPTPSPTPSPAPTPRPLPVPSPSPTAFCFDDCPGTSRWAIGGWGLGALIVALLAAAAAVARFFFYPRPTVSGSITPTALVRGGLMVSAPDLTVEARIDQPKPRASSMTVEEMPDD